MERGGKMPRGTQFWKSIKSYSSAYTRKKDTGYYAKSCSLCDSKPLFRAGRKAYCRSHRDEAVRYWSNKPVKVAQAVILGIDPTKKSWIHIKRRRGYVSHQF